MVEWSFAMLNSYQSRETDPGIVIRSADEVGPPANVRIRQ
jgi:hypothetical protein